MQGLRALDGGPEQKEGKRRIAMVEVALALEEEGGETPGDTGDEDGPLPGPAVALRDGKQNCDDEEDAHGGGETVTQELAYALSAEARVVRGDLGGGSGRRLSPRDGAEGKRWPRPGADRRL